MASASGPPRGEGRRRGEEAEAGSQGREEAPLASPAASAYISVGAVTPRQSSPLCNTMRAASTSEARASRRAGGSAVSTGQSRKNWLNWDAKSEANDATTCRRRLSAASGTMDGNLAIHLRSRCSFGYRTNGGSPEL